MKNYLSNTPLRRDTVTSASRIMLPAYVVHFMVVGFSYSLSPRSLLIKTPGLEFADRGLLPPLWVWGLMFLGAAVALLTAMLSNSRDLSRLALYVAMICMIIWGAVILGATIFSDASPAAASWPLFVALACKATERSLRKEEVS